MPPTVSAASSSEKRDSAVAFDEDTTANQVVGQPVKAKKRKKNEPWPEYFNNVLTLSPFNRFTLHKCLNNNLQLFKVRLIGNRVAQISDWLAIR